MRIAEIVATFPPYHGGMGNVCWQNALALAKRGHSVTVFTLDHRTKPHENDPVEFTIIRLRPWLGYRDAGLVPQLLRHLRNFDVVHLHYPFFGGAEFVYLAALLYKKPYFLTYHMDVLGETLIKKIVLGLYEPFWLKRIMRKAGVVHSPGVDYLRSTKIHQQVDQLPVVRFPYAGVDLKRFAPRLADTELVQCYHLQGKTVILFVGNLLPLKRLDLLLTALAKLNNPKLHLLVVGGGYSEAHYKAMTHELHLEKQVSFVGSQTVDLPRYYNTCDFLVLPSDSESYGLVTLEAMASGKPAIVANLPGPAQLVQHGHDGLLFESGNVEALTEAIQYLATDPLRCQQYGKNGHAKVEQNYSWSDIAEQLEQSFKQLTA